MLSSNKSKAYFEIKNFKNKRFILNEKKDTKINSQIYQERKGPDSPGIFGH